MAGSGNAEENPVGINVVPMVDVIFCLCVFFMCSMKFKQIEGAFESWLPRDRGTSGAPAPVLETRVALFWDDSRRATRRQFGERIVESDSDLEALIQAYHADHALENAPDAPVVLDAEARVPWKDVVAVLNICKRLGIDHIQFALGRAEK